MSNTLLLLLMPTVSYLLGSIPNGLLLSRLKGIDIRKHGSGNIGATNVFRSVSKSLGLLTFFLDFLKGLIPALFFPFVMTTVSGSPSPVWLGIACGCCAIAGHNWPIYLRFKGGKGVATSAGVLLGIAPAAVGVGILCWIVLFVTTRYVSVASIAAALSIALFAWWKYVSDGLLLPVTLTMLAALVIWRHRGNIERLMKGEENRFDFRKKNTAPVQEETESEE